MNSSEEAQLLQTVEMFEVIASSQPRDVQSLEILKEAYSKLGRDRDLSSTSKRIAQAHVLLGQMSSAILEYESILQRFPNDPEVEAALREIRNSAGPHGLATRPAEIAEPPPSAGPRSTGARAVPSDFDDGRQAMHQIFVGGDVISSTQFDTCWPAPDLSTPPSQISEPFVHVLSEKGHVPLEKALRLISNKSRLGFLPLERYDIQVELARSFPRETLFRWCVLPFDRLSSATLVATANPFNKQAAMELAQHTKDRLLWYLSPPAEIRKAIRRIIH